MVLCFASHLKMTSRQIWHQSFEKITLKASGFSYFSREKADRWNIVFPNGSTPQSFLYLKSSFLKICLMFSKLQVCACIYVWLCAHKCMCWLWKPREGTGSTGVGVTDRYEPPDTDAGNWTHVLCWELCMPLMAKPFFQPTLHLKFLKEDLCLITHQDLRAIENGRGTFDALINFEALTNFLPLNVPHQFNWDYKYRS